MSSRTGNLMIGAGAVVAVLGVLMLPAALGEHTDNSLLILGATAISMGSLFGALGIYVRSRRKQEGQSTAEPKNSARRVRGGCDVCHGDQPVIHCRVHQIHLCADCLGPHYDPKSCRYAPSGRRAPAKSGGMARAHGA